MSFLSPGFRIVRQPAHRWLRHRESIPKLPRPPGLGQKECLLSLLFCVKRDQREGRAACCRRFRLPLVLSESRLSYHPSARTPLVALSREHSKTTPATGIGAERMSSLSTFCACKTTMGLFPTNKITPSRWIRIRSRRSACTGFLCSHATPTGHSAAASGLPSGGSPPLARASSGVHRTPLRR